MNNLTIFYVSALVIMGFISLSVVLYIGKFMANKSILSTSPAQNDLLDKVISHYQKTKFKSNFLRHFVGANSEYLQRRNEFFSTYLQVIIAILLIVVIAVLLITKTITAEAGLPILSAISGFAIAKTISATRNDPESN
jgi:hypothetical protein